MVGKYIEPSKESTVFCINGVTVLKMAFFRESAFKMVGYGSINPAGEEIEEEERDSVPTSPISLNKGRRGGLHRQHASQVGRKSWGFSIYKCVRQIKVTVF